MISLYVDENIHGNIVKELRKRGVDILLAIDDDHDETYDEIIMNRATELGRVLVSGDLDMIIIAERRQREGETFSGLIYAHQRWVSVGKCVEDIELITQCETPEEYVNCILRLPLR